MQIRSIYPKIHNLKISLFTKVTISKSHFFTKFTFSKFHFSQNSHFQSLIFHKNHIFKVSFFTKFTFFKHQILGNIWIKSWFLPQCAPKSLKNQHLFEHFWRMGSRQIPLQRKRQFRKAKAWQSFWLSCHAPGRPLRPFCSTGQNPNIWSGCECGQRGNARALAEHRSGRLQLLEVQTENKVKEGPKP